MPYLKDQKIGGSRRFLFKGIPGTGKSCSILGFPKKTYIFDLDGRIKSLIKWAREELKDESILEGIEYDYYGRRDFDKLKAKIDKLEVHNPYETVATDSLTALGDILIEYSNVLRGDKGKTRGLIKIPGPEEYGAEASGMSQIMDILYNLKCNIIVTAHVVETSTKQLDGHDKTERRLLTAGKPIAAKLPIYFNEIYHFGIERAINVGGENKIVVYTDNVGDYDFARSELPLPKKMDITNKKLYEVIRENLKMKGVEL